MMRRLQAQSTLEYIVLIVILIGVLITMQNYIKRGFQGRWKASVDEIGDQYDPAKVNSLITYSQEISSDSFVEAVAGADPRGIALNGFFTNRTDSTSSFETKTGVTTVETP